MRRSITLQSMERLLGRTSACRLQTTCHPLNRGRSGTGGDASGRARRAAVPRQRGGPRTHSARHRQPRRPLSTSTPGFPRWPLRFSIVNCDKVCVLQNQGRRSRVVANLTSFSDYELPLCLVRLIRRPPGSRHGPG